MSWGERSCNHYAVSCPCAPTMATCNILCPHYKRNPNYKEPARKEQKIESVGASVTYPFTKNRYRKLKRKGVLR